MAVEIVPFSEEHLTGAARLVARRVRAERELEPLIPVSFTETDAVLPRVRSWFSRGLGAAALRDHRLAGFMLGWVVEHEGLMTAWTSDVGHGVDDADPRPVYRALYATLSPRWLERGCGRHQITLLAHEPVAEEAFFSLGFGVVGLDALRDLDPPSRARPRGLEIRRADAGDVEQLLLLERLLRRHLESPPICLPPQQPDPVERREWLSQSSHAMWMAFRDGVSIGAVGMEASQQLVMPTSSDRTVAITFAYTVEAARRGGVATAILAHALEWAVREGYDRCSVDFESANLEGSGFWLGSGFRPVCRSLSRCIDGRVVELHCSAKS